MGADISSCCSVEPSPDKHVIRDGETQKPSTPKPSGQSRSGHETPKTFKAPLEEPLQIDVEKFRRKLEDSMDVIVLLADGTRLTCQLKLNYEERCLTISCEKNSRPIPLTELKAVLHGRDQLKRVETKANLVDDPNCVALHMATGNCIPMRFDNIQDKQAFVELIKRLK